MPEEPDGHDDGAIVDDAIRRNLTARLEAAEQVERVLMRGHR
jgi:hypothetical protein